ncbi:MAG: hypothetical protein AB1490_17435 [Pseudomonadota bacterium]
MKAFFVGMVLLMSFPIGLATAERNLNPTGDRDVQRGIDSTRERIQTERALGTRDNSTRDRSETNQGHYNRPDSNYSVPQDQSTFQAPSRGR